MKVLIVGGAGYVGGAMVDLFRDTEHEVRVYDFLLYEDSYRKLVPFVYGDIRDTEKLKPELAWADAVVWLAALVGDPVCAVNTGLATAINDTAVKWFTENYDGRIIFTSTASVYGARDGILDEQSATGPLSVYGITKLQAEKYLQNKNVITFRLGTLFGIGDLFSRVRFDLVVNILVLRAHRDGRIQVNGGNQFRPLLHVGDVGRATLAALNCSAIGTYNVCKQNVRIIDLAYQVRNHFPDIELDIVDKNFEDARNYRISGDKIKNEIGFVPTGTIDNGIEEIKFLLETNRLKNASDPRYSNDLYLTKTEFLNGS